MALWCYVFVYAAFRVLHDAQVALLLVEGGGEKESNEKNSENTHPKPTAPWRL